MQPCWTQIVCAEYCERGGLSIRDTDKATSRHKGLAACQSVCIRAFVVARHHFIVQNH